MMSTNAPSRIHHTIRPQDHDLFYKLGASHFRLYDPDTDPPPIYRRPFQTSVRATPRRGGPLASDVLAIIEEYESEWEERLRAAEQRIEALQNENRRLWRELYGSR
jgi:hypothetical protein